MKKTNTSRVIYFDSPSGREYYPVSKRHEMRLREEGLVIEDRQFAGTGSEWKHLNETLEEIDDYERLLKEGNLVARYDK
ncbi:hypothetical protein OAG60_02465 [bacterium]|nr:hypothetical protein [bacterium]